MLEADYWRVCTYMYNEYVLVLMSWCTHNCENGFAHMLISTDIKGYMSCFALIHSVENILLCVT